MGSGKSNHQTKWHPKQWKILVILFSVALWSWYFRSHQHFHTKEAYTHRELTSGCVSQPSCWIDPPIVKRSVYIKWPVSQSITKTEIRITQHDWSTHKLASHITQILLHDVLGYDTCIQNYRDSDTIETFARIAGCNENKGGLLNCSSSDVEDLLKIQSPSIMPLSFIEEGKPDFPLPNSMVDVEVWLRGKESQYNKWVWGAGNGFPKVTKLGRLGLSGRSGWYVNRDVVNQVWKESKIAGDHWRALQLPKYTQLFEPATSNETINKLATEVCPGLIDEHGNVNTHPIYGCKNGWFHGRACDPEHGGNPLNCATLFGVTPNFDRGILQQQILNLNLNVSIAWIGPAYSKIILERISLIRPVLFYWWEPDLLFAGFPISRITLPPIDASKFTFEESSTAYGPVDCDFMDDPLTKIMWRPLEWLAPPATFLLRALELQHEDMEGMLKKLATKSTTQEFIRTTACTWVLENSNIWRNWISEPPVCTKDHWKVIPHECTADGYRDISFEWINPRNTSEFSGNSALYNIHIEGGSQCIINGGFALPNSTKMVCSYIPHTSDMKLFIFVLSSAVGIIILISGIFAVIITRTLFSRYDLHHGPESSTHSINIHSLFSFLSQSKHKLEQDSKSEVEKHSISPSTQLRSLWLMRSHSAVQYFIFLSCSLTVFRVFLEVGEPGLWVCALRPLLPSIALDIALGTIIIRLINIKSTIIADEEQIPSIVQVQKTQNRKDGNMKTEERSKVVTFSEKLSPKKTSVTPSQRTFFSTKSPDVSIPQEAVQEATYELHNTKQTKRRTCCPKSLDLLYENASRALRRIFLLTTSETSMYAIAGHAAGLTQKPNTKQKPEVRPKRAFTYDFSLDKKTTHSLQSLSTELENKAMTKQNRHKINMSPKEAVLLFRDTQPLFEMFWLLSPDLILQVLWLVLQRSEPKSVNIPIRITTFEVPALNEINTNPLENPTTILEHVPDFFCKSEPKTDSLLTLMIVYKVLLLLIATILSRRVQNQCTTRCKSLIQSASQVDLDFERLEKRNRRLSEEMKSLHSNITKKPIKPIERQKKRKQHIVKARTAVLDKIETRGLFAVTMMFNLGSIIMIFINYINAVDHIEVNDNQHIKHNLSINFSALANTIGFLAMCLTLWVGTIGVKVFFPISIVQRAWKKLDLVLEGEEMHRRQIVLSSLNVTTDDLQELENIGGGAFGDVTKAIWRGTMVAVKRMNVKSLMSSEKVQKFEDEVVLMAGMRHPNVILLMGYSVSPTLLVMEYMPRGSLYQILHGKSQKSDTKDIGLGLLLHMLQDAARGMNFLHLQSPPIIHRDLKSPNVLVNDDWRCKVADFGLSVLKQDEDNDESQLFGDFVFMKKKMEKKRQGVAGSVLWASPEVFRGEEATEKSDVYAFGIIIFECLYREVPYQRASLPSVPLNVVSGKRPPNFAHKYFFKELRAIYEYPNRARQTREREKEESNTMHDPVSISSIQINLTTSTDSHSHDEEVKSEYLTRIVPRNTLKSNIAEGITTENQIELPINQRLSVIDEFIELMVTCWHQNPVLRPPFSQIISELDRISEKFMGVSHSETSWKSKLNSSSSSRRKTYSETSVPQHIQKVVFEGTPKEHELEDSTYAHKVENDQYKESEKPISLIEKDVDPSSKYRIQSLGDSKPSEIKDTDSLEVKEYENALTIQDPTKLEELFVAENIGFGGFGAVYKGFYKENVVAIKRICIQGMPENLIEEFRNECDQMKLLSHPNVVVLIDIIESASQITLIIELLDQSFFDFYQSVEKYAQETHQQFVIRLLRDIASGMSYLHKHGFLHRDLKSENVLLTDSLQAKLTDFGLSRVKDEQKTVTNCGSPLWCAPEVLRGTEFDEKCDVYSFSIIAWEAWNWSLPFAQYDYVQVINGVAFDNLRPVISQDTPKWFGDLMESCWSFNPKDRPYFEYILEVLENNGK